MSRNSSKSYFFRLWRRLKSAVFSVAQHSKVEITKHELEHILLYHNLVGSKAKNEPEFRNVQADIREAIANNNNTNLGIALKLPPLHWEERLQSMFAALTSDERSRAVSLLLTQDPDASGAYSDASPLKHSSWEVRANAANILAFLQIAQADKSIAESLQQASNVESDLAPAFCHLSNALGLLNTAFAKETLIKYLYDPEPWFRVDAARALSLTKDQDILADLMKALLSPHLLSDYMSAVIARQYSLEPLISHPNKIIQAGAKEAVIGVLSASQNTFSFELLEETSLWSCLPALLNFTDPPTSPRHIRAALALIQWWQQNSHLAPPLIREHLSRFSLQSKIQLLSGPDVKDVLISTIQRLPNLQDPLEGRHAIYLTGCLGLSSAAPLLVNLLSSSFPWITDVIEALGQLEQPDTVVPLIAFANEIIDLESRTSRAPSKQPVQEEKPTQAKIYWLILKALGNLPTQDSLAFLHKATQDFAADKREQAYSSYFQVCQSLNCSPANIKGTITEGLNDSSSTVQIASLRAASTFQLKELLPVARKLCASRELSLQKQAENSVKNLEQKGTKASGH